MKKLFRIHLPMMMILFLSVSIAYGQSSSVPDEDYEPIEVDNVDQIIDLTHLQEAGTVSLAWSSNGTQLALGNNGGFVNLYNTFAVEDGPTQLLGFGQGSFVSVVGFSPDDRFVYAGSSDGTLWRWGVRTGAAQDVISPQSWVWSAAMTSDGEIVATGLQDGRIMLWETRRGEQVEEFEASHDDSVIVLAFGPDEWMVSASLDGTTRIWDIETGEELSRFEGHDQGVTALDVNPDGTMIATGSGDTSVRVWDVETGEELFVFEESLGGISDLDFSPDGTMLAVVGQDSILHLYDVEVGEEIAALSGHTNWVHSVEFSGDGKFIGTASFGGLVIVWGVPSIG